MSASVISARSLGEALRALEHATPSTRVLAGGTDLMVELRTGRTQPDLVVDVWRLDELRGIRDENGALRIGALTTCAELVNAPLVRERVDVLAQAADQVGAEQIKNRATLGGNLGTASPAADLNPVLVALAARVRLVSSRGAREFEVEEFLAGYRRTLRAPDELIESIAIPARARDEQRAFRKVGTRAAQSISKLVVALCLRRDGARVLALSGATGSLADRTRRTSELERQLVGEVLEPARIAAAARASAVVDIAPIDDVRSTADYRRQVYARVIASLLGELRESKASSR